MVIEGAVLAGAHALNAAIHAMGYFPPSRDILHVTKFPLEDYWRLRAIVPTLIDAFYELEELRAPYVRGAQCDGESGGRVALQLLETIRQEAQRVGDHGLDLPAWHSGSSEWKSQHGWT